ncbi:hypothetical protein LI328DRAFT_156050 [Trichoderma asperelloides]|nr:hypothetical protein LI328DRAFT_156050 [Trichoderma asperelloides]
MQFQQWLEKNEREVLAASREDMGSRLERLEKISVEKLLKGSTERIIASPREYQIDLYERAKNENTIVVLDTGSGKTLIAALLLRRVLEVEIENRASGYMPKTAFFIVEKVALCFQQHAVLTSNLEFPIGKIFGDMKGEIGDPEFWRQQFSENMAFVCTAQTLLSMLGAGFISMSQINLLVFDEAHHTKKNHAYARIMEAYPRWENERPRILGMTASPVDSSKADVRIAAMDLEEMLCSKIATISDEALGGFRDHRDETERTERYEKLEDPQHSKTQLWEAISRCIGSNPQFKAHLGFAKDASSVLGTWCADRYWQLLATNDEMARLEAKTGRDTLELDVFDSDEAMAAVSRTRDIIRDHQFGPIAKDWSDLSSKVKTLHGVLENAFCQRLSKRCIVFVEQRATAFLLTDLFQQPEMSIPGMRVAYMIGSNASSANAANMSLKGQVVSLQKFKRGETNCLFATSVAEEGIDVPECDVVIRFDLCVSAIQYIQSKGRARQSSFLYVTMVESNNIYHHRKFQQAKSAAFELQRFCRALPEDRKVEDFDVRPDVLKDCESIITTAAGGGLKLIDSLACLAKYASSLSKDGLQKLEYVVKPDKKQFIASVVLPDGSPIKTIQGVSQRTKQLARCSAAFEACRILIERGYIDKHLQPAFAKKLPAMRNSRLALSADKKSEYEMLVKPKFWSLCLGPEPPTTLYQTTISLSQPAALGNPSRPLILLSRNPLPDIPSAPLFFGGGQTSIVRLSHSKRPLEVTSREVIALSSFTLRLFAHVFSKEYEAEPRELPYFIAPCSVSGGKSRADVSNIDWEVVYHVGTTERLEWRNAPIEFFKDKLAMDPWDGSRKYILSGINERLKPSDPTPDGVPQPKSAAYRKVEQNIKEYSNSLSLQSRKRRDWSDDQPVVNAELLSIRRNFLDEYFIDDEGDRTCYIILEPLVVSPLPIDIVFMALVLPVVMYRIDSVLIASEICSSVDLTILPGLALEAVTKDSFNIEEHGEDQLDFQPGMGKNYERLEFLGDTFLKMATTISVYTLYPRENEFEYHVKRMLMLNNRNLFTHAVKRNWPGYIRTKAFDRRTWYPSDIKLRKGKVTKAKAKQHCLSHKSIADVCEALIGAAYLTSKSNDNMDMAVKAVTSMVNSEDHTMTEFSDYFAKYTAPEWHSYEPTAAQRNMVECIAEITGYRFRCPPLLRSAFKHSSYVYEEKIKRDYQQLEFLGDALIDMVVVDFLYNRFPEADPKWLTEHKMAMVSNQFLGFLCVRLGLSKHLMVATSPLHSKIREYTAEAKEAEEKARARKKSQDNDAAATSDKGPSAEVPGVTQDFWVEIQQPPKALADVVEALVGAMFVDSGYSFSIVRDFFAKFIQPYFEDMALLSSFASNHPVTVLIHALQDDFRCTQWKLHMASVPPSTDDAGVAILAESELLCALMIHGNVIAHATSTKSGVAAKLAVAKLALKTLASIQDASHFRTEMGCDCGGGGSAAALN